jgi:hypothetical protein
MGIRGGNVLVKVECQLWCSEHDLARTVSAEIVECGGEEEREVEVERELDDEDWVSEVFPWVIVAFSIYRCVLANVPTCDGRGPVELETLKAEFAEVVDEVFRGEAKHAGNGWKIACTGFWEVTRKDK